MELLKNAWAGWQNYIHYGKLAALFLAAAVYLILRGKKERPVWQLTVYGALMGMLCIFPPAAACLMLYQTRFFDYEWIWSCVPVTAVTALGGTVFLTEHWKKHNYTIKNTCYNIALTGFAVVIILLGGGLGQSGTDFAKGYMENEKAAQVLEQAGEICGAEELCIWAPREILEYARVQRGDVRLLYGRNMWDISLNAYSYDTYPQELETLYLWMERLAGVEEWNTGDPETETLLADGSVCLRSAISLGANCILLPGNLPPEQPFKILCEEGLPTGVDVVRLDDYYLVTVLEAAYE